MLIWLMRINCAKQHVHYCDNEDMEGLQQRVTLPPSPLLCPRKNLFCNNESCSRRNFLSSVTTSCDNFGFLGQHHVFLGRVKKFGFWEQS